MKLLSTILALLSLANCDTTPDKVDSKISETTTFEVTSSTKGKESVKVNYYTKQLTDKKTKKTQYESHGNCYVNDLDITGYDHTIERKFTCEIGLY